MILRPPTYLDALRIWRWRNHPSTRKWMGDQERIGLIEHLRWFRKVRFPPTRTHLFMADNGRTVGMGRLDVADGGRYPFVYEAGVLVAPGERGKGYGTAIIEATTKAAGGERVRAKIRSDNAASVKAFKRAGYFLVAADREFDFMEHHK